MSSPIGGFYIAAHNRKKAKAAELASRLQLQINLLLQVDGIVLLQQEQLVYAGEENLFESYGAQVKLNACKLSDELFQITCQVEQKQANEQLTPLGTQLVNLADGESISTLVEGNEGVRLTVGCRLQP